MILKVISHLILINAHPITGSPRMISSENLLEIWQRYRPKKNSAKKNVFMQEPTFLYKKNSSVKTQTF